MGGESGIQWEMGGRISEWCRQRGGWKRVTRGRSFEGDKFGQLRLGERGLIVSLDGTTSQDNATELACLVCTAPVGILLARFTRTCPLCAAVVGLVHWWLRRWTPVGGGVALRKAVKILAWASKTLCT